MKKELTCLLIDPRENAYESESESFKERIDYWINKYTSERQLSGVIHSYETWFHIDDDSSFKPEKSDILINPLLDYMDNDHDEYIVDIDNVMYAAQIQEKNSKLLCIFTLHPQDFSWSLDSEIENLQSEMKRQLPNFKGIYVNEENLDYSGFVSLIETHLS